MVVGCLGKFFSFSLGGLHLYVGILRGVTVGGGGSFGGSLGGRR